MSNVSARPEVVSHGVGQTPGVRRTVDAIYPETSPRGTLRDAYLDRIPGITTENEDKSDILRPFVCSVKGIKAEGANERRARQNLLTKVPPQWRSLTPICISHFPETDLTTQ